MAADFQINLIDPVAEPLRNIPPFGVRILQQGGGENERTPPVDLNLKQAEMVGTNQNRPHRKSLQLKGELKMLCQSLVTLHRLELLEAASPSESRMAVGARSSALQEFPQDLCSLVNLQYPGQMPAVTFQFEGGGRHARLLQGVEQFLGLVGRKKYIRRAGDQ
jgi:hypothetical protein